MTASEKFNKLPAGTPCPYKERCILHVDDLRSSKCKRESNLGLEFTCQYLAVFNKEKDR